MAGVAAAVGLLIGVLTCLELHDARSEEIVAGKEEETRVVMGALKSDVKKAMHGLGYNAIILPKDQPLGDWYAQDYAAKAMPEYSTWKPATISDSPSATSKGARLVSATAEIK